MYTLQPKSFRTDCFKNQRHITSFIQNKLNWHITRVFQGCSVSEKLPKIPLFGPSLIHQLQLLGSQQHPQKRVLLISFSTWGTENSLAHTILESTGMIRGCNIVLGQKLAKTCSCVFGHIIVQEKNLKE